MSLSRSIDLRASYCCLTMKTTIPMILRSLIMSTNYIFGLNCYDWETRPSETIKQIIAMLPFEAGAQC